MIRTDNPFTGDGEWLKAALHTHTIRSDGDLEPVAHVRHHAWMGFDVCAITDHWKVTREPSVEGCLVLTGAELASDPLGPGRYTEILAIGIEEIPEDPGGDRAYWEPIDNYFFKTFPDLTAAGRSIREQGGVSFVAHPYWSGLPVEVLLTTEGVDGLEVFNSSAERENGRGDSSYVWDQTLEAGKPYLGFGTDDCHYPGFDIGDAWTMVRAAERSPEAVLEALRAGRTYASAGPAILDLVLDGDAVEIRCSPARAVVLVSRHETGWAVRADGRNRMEEAWALERDDAGHVVRARFTPSIDLPYRRVVVEAPNGRRAWTNAI
ncbi:MAG TPA: CehA/McbA family metallohydrolase [Actinomycetota bacterium]|nr:CehA/McbA family metallohydrolase [Actinomycetota bacterium]